MDIFCSVEDMEVKDGQRWAKGRVCVNGNFEDIEIKAKIERVAKAKTSLSNKARRELNGIASNQFNCHLKHLSSSTPYRVQQRREQLKGGLKRELAAAFRCKHHRRSFSFGFCNQEVDLNIFGLDIFGKRRRVFNYKEDSIANLDHLMGEGWDVEVGEGKIVFVTQLSVCLNREGIMNGQISTAFCHDPLPAGTRMRNHLKKYVAKNSVSPHESACSF